jgi:hypothetical protein
MSSSHTPQTLQVAPRIGLLGDLHGDIEHLLLVAKTMREHGVFVMVQLGDFGFVWPQRNWGMELSKISRRLAAHHQTLYFADGNHEDFSRLYRFPVGEDGLRWLRPNIAHLPRGWRTTLASGRSLAALGGANSIDYASRTVGSSWWLEESITDSDLAALGDQPVDILIGHDAPLALPTLDDHLRRTNGWWPAEAQYYSASGRAMFHRGFMQARPKLCLGGHYHVHVDEQVAYSDERGTFNTRVVILDMNGPNRISQAILDVATLELRFLSRDDRTVVELTGHEIGRWKANTSDSSYLFDFDAGTVQRSRTEIALSAFADTTQRLHSIERCRLGQLGAWTLVADDGRITQFQSGQIHQIEPEPGT